jgi:uncharacterized damage-inducible protein DinB
VNAQDIRTLYAYNLWANRRTTMAARQLDPHDLSRPLGASHSSVRGTLVHILWAEWIWLRRWLGESPKLIFAPEDFADVPAIEVYWQGIERERQEFIAQLTSQRMKELIAYENMQGERWEYSLAHMMQHVVNHSSYHRGQVVVLLRQLGHKVESTDFLVYFDETPGASTSEHTE